MSPTVIRAAGLATTTAYAVMIGWLFVQQPRTLAQVAGGVSDSIGAYRIDEVAFADGLRFFRADQFPEARAAFQRADPAQRDARTQFYIAYAYYRQGWGRIYHDDPLYRLGLEHVKMAIALAPNGRLVLDEPDLGMQSADELRAELERGLTREAEDFNPLKLFNERK
jgi:tetratricopeptide (TPR) repeat protein